MYCFASSGRVILDSRLAACGRIGNNGVQDWLLAAAFSRGEAVDEIDANTLLGGKLTDDEVDWLVDEEPRSVAGWSSTVHMLGGLVDCC